MRISVLEKRISLLILLVLLAAFLFAWNTLKSAHIDSKVTRSKNDNSNTPELLLFVAIFSANKRSDRRAAIRKSWMVDCNASSKAKCRFFADKLDENGKPMPQSSLAPLQEESKANGDDLILLDSPSGMNFAVRTIIVMEYVLNTTQFEFLLRIDDDQFLCFDRLVQELPHRPKEGLYWGHTNCFGKNVAHIDDGWLVMSHDLVRDFVSERDNLQCHPHGMYTLAMWIYKQLKIRRINWYSDDRIHHDPTVSKIFDKFRDREEICHTYISLHGAYPKEMLTLQKILDTEKLKFSSKSNYHVPPVSDNCEGERDVFDWRWFKPPYLFEPVLCSKKPLWNRAAIWAGREGAKS